MTATIRLTGHTALKYAEARGLTLSKYTDPIEEARDGLALEEARDIAYFDPSLIYVDATPAASTLYATVRLSDLAGRVEDMVGEADPLRPGAEPAAVIVEMSDGRVVDIVDGFHRTAGYVAWARKEGLDLHDVIVRVAIPGDSHLIALAAEPGPMQDEALAAIYAAAE